MTILKALYETKYALLRDLLIFFFTMFFVILVWKTISP